MRDYRPEASSGRGTTHCRKCILIKSGIQYHERTSRHQEMHLATAMGIEAINQHATRVSRYEASPKFFCNDPSSQHSFMDATCIQWLG